VRPMRLALPLLVLLAGACIPPPTPTPAPTQHAPVASTPQAASVEIAASGQVDLLCPQGMLASIVIRPATGEGSPEPVWLLDQDDRIELDLEPTACGTAVVGPPRDGHRTLAPGRYDVAAVLEILSDTIDLSSAPVPGQTEPAVPACVVPVEVTATTNMVRITVDFDGALTAPCTVSVETE